MDDQRVADPREREQSMADQREREQSMADQREREQSMADPREREQGMADQRERKQGMADQREREQSIANQRERDQRTVDQGEKNQSGKEQGEKDQDQKIRETGQIKMEGADRNRIQLISIIGEIEGHENLSGNTKATKYEHILPKLAEIEESGETDGVLVLINTVGGDVSCGLALAEMIASLSRPTVSLVIGDSHSIGVPLAVATDYSFIVPTGTMMVHPVRMTGMVIGAVQTYDYFEMIQDRILSFVSGHSRISYERLRSLMLNTEMMTKDLGTVLVGQEAVKEGLIDSVGGIREALEKLNGLIDAGKKSRDSERKK